MFFFISVRSSSGKGTADFLVGLRIVETGDTFQFTVLHHVFHKSMFVTKMNGENCDES